MNAKYQVFVSSTYVDLKDERDLVIKATLEMGHIPVGMEMFSAADEEQWNIIKRQIDESDYYVVIIAHRYGTCDKNGLSYTEKEYDYAASKGIPVLGFILDSGTSWPLDKSETDAAVKLKLEAFKEKVRLKPVSFWKNKEDLYGRCSIALMKAFTAYPREGWVRASNAQDVAAARELVRLSAENSALREKLAVFEAQESIVNSLEKTILTLKSNSRKVSVWKKASTDWDNSVPPLTLYQIFESIGPEMQVEIELHSLAIFFAMNLCKVPARELRTNWPVPRNTLRLILADLAALGCVQPSQKRKPIADKNEYWSLAEHGLELLALMRRRRLEKVELSVEVKAQDSSTDMSVEEDQPGAGTL